MPRDSRLWAGPSWEYSSEQPGKLKRLVRLPAGDLALVTTSDRGAGAVIEVAAGSRDGAREGAARVADLLRAEPSQSDPRLKVLFWSQGRSAQFMGPRRRRLEVPTLAELAPNYSHEVAAALERLGSLRPADQLAGRLILWHGPPGTGKTWALRGLANAWREWCELHYVTDPELFLGAETGYMMQVIEDDDGLFDESDEEEEPWRLVALEDAGELLTVDAARHTGQAFSRLLNVVDGLLGQGLRVILLITTNEPLGKLHPRSPGRAAPSRASNSQRLRPTGPANGFPPAAASARSRGRARSRGASPLKWGKKKPRTGDFRANKVQRRSPVVLITANKHGRL